MAQQSLGLDFGATRLLAPNIYLKSNIGFNVGLIYQNQFSKNWGFDADLRYVKGYNNKVICGFASCFYVEEKSKQLNTSLSINLKILEKKWFQWKYGTGINVSTFAENFELPSDKFNFDNFRFSILGRNYFNFKITQLIDLQLITNIYLSKSLEFNSDQIQMNTGIRYKF